MIVGAFVGSTIYRVKTRGNERFMKNIIISIAVALV
jgi:hypothetical protein